MRRSKSAPTPGILVGTKSSLLQDSRPAARFFLLLKCRSSVCSLAAEMAASSTGERAGASSLSLAGNAVGGASGQASGSDSPTGRRSGPAGNTCGGRAAPNR